MLDETLKFHEFQSGGFNGFLKLPPKNIEIRHFSPKYQEKFEGVGSKYDQSFQILT